MDVFGLYALAGVLAGFIIGDLQREFRTRREALARVARDNLTRSLAGPVADANRHNDSGSGGHDDSGSGGHDDPDSGSHGNRHRGTSRAVSDIRNGQARRRAVSRAHVGSSVTAPVRGRGLHSAHAATVGVGYDCG